MIVKVNFYPSTEYKKRDVRDSIVLQGKTVEDILKEFIVFLDSRGLSMEIAAPYYSEIED